MGNNKNEDMQWQEDQWSNKWLEGSILEELFPEYSHPQESHNLKMLH